jgi:hypothetical protein
VEKSGRDSMRPVRGTNDLAGARCHPEENRRQPSGQVWTGDPTPDASYLL